MALEQRVSRLEGAYEQVDRRLDELSRSIESLRTEMNGLRAEMNGLRTEMNNRFNNVYVLIGGSWVTIMVAIIGLYIKG